MTANPTPTFAPDVLAMVKRVAGLADIYWHKDCFPKTFVDAQQDWLAALVQLVADYSFERQGAPPIYRTYARKALHTAGADLSRPTPLFINGAWTEFMRLAGAKNHRCNPNVNALFPSSSPNKITATEFASSLNRHGYNLLTWAVDLLSKGKAEDAVKELRRVRGIDYKIATFYLRDVVRAMGLDEQKAGPGWCFQPVDVWVRRAAIVWGSLVSRPVTDDRTAAELIVDLATAAGIGGGDLNGGVWILGSQLVDRNLDPDLSQTLSSSAKLEACLDMNLRWNRAIIAGIERLPSQ